MKYPSPLALSRWASRGYVGALIVCLGLLFAGAVVHRLALVIAGVALLVAAMVLGLAVVIVLRRIRRVQGSQGNR